MRRVAGLLCAGALVLAACASDDDESASTTSSAARAPSSTTSPTSTVRTEPALLSDEPCTRTVTGEGAVPARAPFHLDDLERMVLSRDDVGGLRGFESDIGRHGYWGNGELRMLEVNPPSTCDLMKDHGRISGFANAYSASTQPTQQVTFAAHLFWDDAGANAWAEAYIADMRTSAGTPDGPSRVEVRGTDALGPGGVAVEHVGPDGTRSWAVFVRGPIVGWVVDLHQGARGHFDVVAAASTMAARVEQVAADAGARGAGGPDAAQVLSAPLTLADWGERTAALQWDPFLGGCADAEERAAIAGEGEAEDARAFRRVVGCTSMYAPDDDATSDIVRVFSSVQVFRDEQGAKDDVADSLAELEAGGGRRFDAGSIGDEALGIVVPPDGDAPYTHTRVVVRVGNIEATVALQDKTNADVKAELTALATRLYERLARLGMTVP